MPMNYRLSRRDFISLVGMGLALPLASSVGADVLPRHFRIRTITAGLQILDMGNFKQAEAAVAFLKHTRKNFIAEGYEVQTLRLATQPLMEYLPDWSSQASLDAIKALDRFAVDNGVVCSIGPVITTDEYHQGFASWATELIQHTKNISFTCQVASAEQGVHHKAIRTAAETVRALAKGTQGGEGNFNFAATGFIPSGTPFFPAAHFDQGQAFSIGLESPNLLTRAFSGATNLEQAKQQLKTHLQAALGAVDSLAHKIADDQAWSFLGIDASPAPGLDASIGKAIEALTHTPFGSASTLSGCAAITDVLKGLSIKTCGYSGLMLPVLEDPVLAQRAAEGRYGVSDLLLFSSVCGTGLDVVPLPGDTSVDVLAAVISDVAALSAKYQKPLSARLFPIVGKQAGDMVSFDNPYLTKSIVMPVG
jgi:uncharacterized protein (UPF0210 family)